MSVYAIIFYLLKIMLVLAYIDFMKFISTFLIFLGPIGKMLTMKIFQPLSKMSNCVFLVHPLVIRAIVLSTDSSMHLSSGIIVS